MEINIRNIDIAVKRRKNESLFLGREGLLAGDWEARTETGTEGDKKRGKERRKAVVREEVRERGRAGEKERERKIYLSSGFHQIFTNCFS